MLPDIENSEYNRAKIPDFTAISAEHEKRLQNCPREEKVLSVINAGLQLFKKPHKMRQETPSDLLSC